MREPTRQRSGQTLDVEPIGSAGLDLQTNPALLPLTKLRTARNISLVQDALERRKASVKTSVFADATDAYGAKTLTDSKYARFTPPLFPEGGFALKYAFTAERPGAGLAYVFSSWTAAAQTHGVVWSTISTTGVVVVKVEWEGGGVTTLTTPPITAGAEMSALLVYYPHAGTLTLYLARRDVQEDVVVQATGLADDLRPRQDAGVTWYLGCSFKPGTGSDSGTGLGAAMGPFIGFAFRGADLLAGGDGSGGVDDLSLLGELRQGAFQDWPNPASRMILFHYPMRESAVGDAVPMYDASKFQNDGAYVGTPATAAALVWGAMNGNVVMTVRKASIGAASDASVNIVACGGAAYYSEIQQGE